MHIHHVHVAFFHRFNVNYGSMGLLDWLHGTDMLFHGTVQEKRHHTLYSLTPVSQTFPDKDKDSNKE